MPVDDANTLSLIHFDGEINTQNYIDESGLSWATSNTLLKDTQVKFGVTSALFSGSSYLLRSSDTVLAFGAGDFTLEMWVFPTTSGTLTSFFDNRNSPTGVPIVLSREIDGTLRSYDGVTLRTGGAIPANQWVHLAWTRASGANKIFVNGTAQHIFTNGNNYGASVTTQIGNDKDGNGFVGYIDEFRISNIARWTSNFTPPTAPYGPITSTTNASAALLLTEIMQSSAGKASGALLLSEIQPASAVRASGLMLLVEILGAPTPTGIVDITLPTRSTAATLRTKRKTYATLNERETALTLEERP